MISVLPVLGAPTTPPPGPAKPAEATLAPADKVTLGQTEQPRAIRPWEKTHPTPIKDHVANAACGAAALWVGANVALQVASEPTALAVAGAAALATSSAVAGYLAADLLNGHVHFALDLYSKETTPILGAMVKDARGHHLHPLDVFDWSFATSCATVSKFAWLPIAATAATDPHYAASAALLTLFGGSVLGNGGHRWAHMPDNAVPRVGKLMQKLHMVPSRQDHATHHRLSWEEHFCLVNGFWNPLLARTGYWRKLEKAIYQTTGAESKAWRDPGVKALALGQINMEQFLADRHADRQIFLRKVKAENAAADS